MKRIIPILVTGFIISSCSRQIFIYKTNNFNLKTKSSIYISNNDYIKCSPVYSVTWSLNLIDSLSKVKSTRDFNLKQSLIDNFKKKEIKIVDNVRDADYKIDFQDYWLCTKKQNLGSLALRLKNQNDTTQGAIIICKSFDVTAKLDYNKEISRIVNKLYQSDYKFYKISTTDFINYPKINDVPAFPKKQIGISFGYSIGQLPLSDLREKYETYYNGINICYGGLDFDYFFKNASGIGIKAIYYYGSNNQLNVNQLDDYNNIIGSGPLKDNINFLFIGPSLIFRIPIFSYNYFDLIKISPGYLRYENNSIRFDEALHYKGQSLACIISAGLDFKITSHINIGLEPKFIYAGFKQMEINGKSVDFDKKERLSRVEIAFVLKVN